MEIDISNFDPEQAEAFLNKPVEKEATPISKEKKPSNHKIKKEKESKSKSKSKSKSRTKKKKHHRSSSRSKSNKSKGRRKHRSRSRSYHKKERPKEKSRERNRSRDKEEKEKKKREYDKHQAETDEERKKAEEQQKMENDWAEAKRQMEEAKRDDSTVLISSINLNADERDLYKYLSQLNIGKIRDIRMIKDGKQGKKSKGVAYVEFFTIDSALKAVTMNGIDFMGQKLLIKPSQADKNRITAQPKIDKRIKPQYDPNNPEQPSKMHSRIYVIGLTDTNSNITEADLRELFSQFGEIEFVNIHRDPETKKCKGFAYIQFKNIADAKACAEKMDGYKLNGKPLKVSLVTSHMINHQNENHEAGGDKGALPQNPALNKPGVVGLLQKLKEDKPPLAEQPAIAAPKASTTPTNYVLMTGMFSLSDIQGDQDFFVELREEVKTECGKYGVVETVLIECSSEGNIWVKFKDINSAINAATNLTSRYFNSKRISCCYALEDAFQQKLRSPTVIKQKKFSKYRETKIKDGQRSRQKISCLLLCYFINTHYIKKKKKTHIYFFDNNNIEKLSSCNLLPLREQTSIYKKKFLFNTEDQITAEKGRGLIQVCFVMIISQIEIAQKIKILKKYKTTTFAALCLKQNGKDFCLRNIQNKSIQQKNQNKNKLKILSQNLIKYHNLHVTLKQTAPDYFRSFTDYWA